MPPALLVRFALMSVALLAGVGRAAPVQPASGELAVTGRWLVALRGDVPPEHVEALAQELVGANGRVLAVWSSALRGFLVETPDANAPRLASHPLVTRVVQDHRIPQPFSVPIGDCSVSTSLSGPVPSLPQAIDCADPDPQNASATCVDNWGLDRLDGASTTRDGLYNPPRTGLGVHLFILDSGLYAQHQDFAGRVGLGFDATATGGATDDCGSWSHGSHVAGIAAGTRFGVAKRVTLHPVRVATCPVAIQLSYLVAGFDWIAQAHASTITGPAVASLSINSTSTEFTDPTSMLNTAITGVLNAGVLVVESAGNNLEDACNHVSRAPGVLVVGGSDEFDTPWERVPADPNYAGWCTGGGDCGSNSGACVSLFAPATHIVSSWYGTTVDPRNMCRLSGTSMAAPHAAGAAALYLQGHPTATPAQVKQGLIDQARAVLTGLTGGSPNKLLSVLEGQPGAGFGPASVDFGTVNVGRTATQAAGVVVTSTGAAPLHVTSVTITGPQGSDFSLFANGCTQPLATGATCNVSLTFAPTLAGRRDATVVLTTDDPTRATVSIPMFGLGADPRLTVLLDGDGAGSVDSAPAGISCGGACTSTFPLGTRLTLTATPAPGSAFAGWGDAGACTTANCSLVLTQATILSAGFTRTTVDAGEPDAGVSEVDAGVVDAGVVDAGRATPPDAGTTATPGTPDAGAPALVKIDAAAGGCGCGAVDASALMLAAMLLLRRSAR